ncbi:MAG TPA: hypothetical protein VJH65_02400 [Candidatus Nanoarchaeia archaeon]|nr:hypothetical protein [Candidatus Nanoarchaeia archaeon]
MDKKLFKSKKGEIHFGRNCSEGFEEAGKSDVEDAISKLKKNKNKNKKFWRCNVCNDLYLGEIPPYECPTCHSIEAYVEIDEKEFRKLIGI